MLFFVRDWEQVEGIAPSRALSFVILAAYFCDATGGGKVKTVPGVIFLPLGQVDPLPSLSLDVWRRWISSQDLNFPFLAQRDKFSVWAVSWRISLASQVYSMITYKIFTLPGQVTWQKYVAKTTKLSACEVATSTVVIVVRTARDRDRTVFSRKVDAVRREGICRNSISSFPFLLRWYQTLQWIRFFTHLGKV